MKTIITSNSSLHTILRSRSAIILITLTLMLLIPIQRTQAVSPPPDGGYAGGNTAEGQGALLTLTNGTFNTAAGFLSLRALTEGNFNTALGAGTLLANTADQNTATGAAALLSNTIGSDNTANGAFALFSNTEGAGNTASGELALFSNTMGAQNTATGFQALNNNTTGGDNAAFGDQALLSSTTGGGNTAVGAFALLNNTTGVTNTALGFNAGFGITTADNVIVIGTNVAGQNVDHGCFIGEIFGQTSSSGTAVFINSEGRLGTATSSRRFKEAIKPMDQASESLFALEPVTFHYKKEIDPTSTPQFGLVAEEVEKVDPALVVRDKEGKPYTVRYDQVNAMLLNEFLKEHRKNEERENTIAELKSGMAALAATVKEQASQIQKVSARLEAGKFASGRIRGGGPAPQVVNYP